MQACKVCVWHYAIGSSVYFNLWNAVAGPPDSMSYGGFRAVYGNSVLCSWSMAFSVLAIPSCCSGLRGDYWDMCPWKDEMAVTSCQVCVAPRPKNGPGGEDGRDVGHDEQQQLSAARPFEVAA